MNIADVTRGERGFTITWDDQSEAEFPYIWLRDNDPGDLHPDTRERVFDLTSVELDIRPASFSTEAESLYVSWPQKESKSTYSADWLHLHRPGSARPDDSKVSQTYWDKTTLGEIPQCDAVACRSDASALFDALRTLKQYGILIIAGLDDTPDASDAFGDLIGFKRQTNFGVMFEVISRPQPHNLAYTSIALPLHTDLPNQELIPGYQFLHIIRNDTTGGESVFADGFQILADLQNDAPDDFAVLSETELPFRFHDDSNDIRKHRPVISTRADGGYDYLVFNAHIADLPDMPIEDLYDFYAAYRRLMVRIRDERYAVRQLALPGQLIIFDNTRVLHGRAAFDAASGERYFRGYYIERNEIDSRMRVLARMMPGLRK